MAPRVLRQGPAAAAAAAAVLNGNYGAKVGTGGPPERQPLPPPPHARALPGAPVRKGAHAAIYSCPSKHKRAHAVKDAHTHMRKHTHTWGHNTTWSGPPSPGIVA